MVKIFVILLIDFVNLLKEFSSAVLFNISILIFKTIDKDFSLFLILFWGTTNRFIIYAKALQTCFNWNLLFNHNKNNKFRFNKSLKLVFKKSFIKELENKRNCRKNE